MTNQSPILRFIDNGIIREICSPISGLKKEGASEVLYTGDGHRIMLDDLLSMNGMSWV
jgi:hypothetical protein